MPSQLLDIILIALAIVILLHLFYNSSLFDTSCDNTKEHLSLAEITDVDKVADAVIQDKKEIEVDPIPKREERQKGMDETDPKKTPYYHVTNKLLTEDELPKKNNNTESAKQGVKFNSNCQNDLAKLDGRQMKMTDKNYKILFGDTYDGQMTSDPHDIGLKKVPETFNLKAFEDNNPNEQYIDRQGNVCSVSKGAENMKRYIRDYVLDGKKGCECAVDKSKHEFTNDEINDYRQEHIEFRDKIYGSSAPAEDPVDKMNEIALNGGMSNIKGNGQKISEFYDNIVTCDNGVERISNLNGPGFVHGSSAPKDKCVKAPILDFDGAVPTAYYMGKQGLDKYYMRDNWMYNNENPNNGGALYDGLKGFDPMMGDMNRTI